MEFKPSLLDFVVKGLCLRITELKRRANAARHRTLIEACMTFVVQGLCLRIAE